MTITSRIDPVRAPREPAESVRSKLLDASDSSFASSVSTSLALALDRVGDRWTLLTVAALLNGPRRFGELEELVKGIASNVLTSRLRALEGLGVVVATPYSTRPPRFEYQLSDAGHALADAIRLLAAWGSATSSEATGPVHSACSTHLEVRYYCPTCDEVIVDPDEVWL
jgi:DNA-binding HxlR family transcriptional regulator